MNPEIYHKNKYSLNKENLFLFVASVFVYFMLATGKLFPEPVLSEKTFISIVNVAFILFYINSRVFRKSLVKTIFLIFPILIFFLCSMFRSNDISLALSKVEGGILSGLFIAAVVSFIILLSNEKKFIKLFIMASFLLLTLTLLYRFSLGLSGRNERFLLNGPIVFGWLMGLNFIFCIKLFFLKRSNIYLLLSFLFILAVFWTQSKGPLLASIVIFSILMLKNANKENIKLMLFISIFLLFSYYLLNYLDLGDRYSALTRLFNNELNESDQGSVGIRAEMFFYSIELWKNNFMFGVGLGNWNEHINRFFSLSVMFPYPHNIIVELLSETGFSGFLFLMISYLYLFIKSNYICKIVMLYFTICLLFSGDASYLRFLFSLPLGFLIARKIEIRKNNN